MDESKGVLVLSAECARSGICAQSSAWRFFVVQR